MAELEITSGQLNSMSRDQGYPYNFDGSYILFFKPGWHFRADLAEVDDHHNKYEAITNRYGDYRGKRFYVTSVHFKKDKNSSFITSRGPHKGNKVNVEEPGYVYFAYMGAGVWQPVWGYEKKVHKNKGKTIKTFAKNSVDDATWGTAHEKMREFLTALGNVLNDGKGHGLANGPIQSPMSDMFGTF